MVLYPILLSQSWSTTVPILMLVSRIAQSGQNLALSRLAIKVLHFSTLEIVAASVLYECHIIVQWFSFLDVPRVV